MKPNVFQFSNYREFLRTHFEYKNQLERNFNVSQWARRLSLKSSSTMLMILNGTRNPGEGLVEDLALNMGLSDEETQYFKILVQLEKTKTNSYLRSLILEKLPKENQDQAQLIQMKYFRLVSEWYFFALRELVDLPDFQEDEVWIQKRLRFHLSKKQITECYEVLVHCELLRRDENGRLEYSEPVTSTFDLSNPDIKKFHKGALELCKQAVDQIDVSERELINITFTCNSEDLPLLKKKIRSVLDGFRPTEKKPDDTVYMLEAACIPLTQKLNSNLNSKSSSERKKDENN